MKFLKKILIFFLPLFITVVASAQNGKESSFGEMMRSNDRIYVVGAVMLTILLGLILYLVRLDRKISKLEKE